MALDFEGLNRHLLNIVMEILPRWLPGGRLDGHEYCCGNLTGMPGDSLKINTVSGKWQDFASGERGGDLISLYAAIENMGNGEAYKKLNDEMRDGIKTEIVKRPMLPIPKPVESFGIPPANTQMPSFVSTKYNCSPTATWTYRNKDGHVAFFIARYDTPETGKQFTPWSWCTNRKEWVNKMWKENRPLYGLENLKKYPDKPVLIVEGEKSADAIRPVVDSVYVVISWSSGANAWKKTDFTPLRGRKLLLWPDADKLKIDDHKKAEKYGRRIGELIPWNEQPGNAAMFAIAESLLAYCPEIKLIDVNDIAKPSGWDAADAVKEGMRDFKRLAAWAKPRARLLGQPEAKEAEVIPKKPKEEPLRAILDEDSGQYSQSVFSLWLEMGLALMANGSPVINIDNIIRSFEWLNEFKEFVWYDEFYKKIMTNWNSREPRQWTQMDDLKLMLKFQRELGFRKATEDMINKAIRIYADMHRKNAPAEWFNSLRWDGVPRLDSLLFRAFGSAMTPYTVAVSKNWLISAVARVLDPGCKVDEMVILESKEGVRKTSAIEALVGREWYLECKTDATHKDFLQEIQGKVMIELAELYALRKAGPHGEKIILDTRVDEFRAPYDRLPMPHPRSCVFVGTTNDKQYLKSQTGNRRMMPVDITRIDLDYIKANRSQIWAEAVARYKDSESWWDYPMDEAREQQELRREYDEWEGIIADHLAKEKKESYTTYELAYFGLKIDPDRIDARSQRRIGSAMRQLGWENTLSKNGEGQRRRCWIATTPF